MANQNNAETRSKTVTKDGKVIGAETREGELELVKLLSSIPTVKAILKKGKIVQVNVDKKGKLNEIIEHR